MTYLTYRRRVKKKHDIKSYRTGPGNFPRGPNDIFPSFLGGWGAGERERNL